MSGHENPERPVELEYRTVLNLTPDAFGAFDRRGRFLDANQACSVLLGYEREELLHLSIQNLDAVETPEETARHLAEIARMGAQRFESRLRRKDGLLIDVEVSAIFLPDGAGRFYAFVREITGRKRAEEALRQSEQRFRFMTENIADVVWSIDLESGRFSYVSPSVERLRGFTVAEVISQSWAEALTSPSLERISALLPGRLAAFAEGDESVRVMTHEVDQRRKDGSIVRTEVTTTLLADAQRHVTGILGVSRDITARKAAEERLRRSEQKFRTLVENVPGAVYRCEVGAPWRVEYVSEGIAAITGHPPADFLDGSVPDYATVILPEDLPEVERLVAEAVAADRPYELEYRIRHADGSVRWVFERGRATSAEDGRRTVLEGVFIDVTDRKQAELDRSELEELLRQAQRLESIGRLAGGVAHDFNNLLTVIGGYADLAISRVIEGDPLHADLWQIRQASERAASLTRQLLAFSRKQVVEPKPVDVNTLIREAERMLRRLLGESIELVTVLAPDAWLVLADAGQIHQVVMNLSLNGRDAMPYGGKLLIASANVDLASSDVAGHPDMKPGSYLELTVADSGVGMDAETQKHIFEPFFTTKLAGMGTGLGLSTVYGIVRQAGGIVRVASERGSGTTVRIYLPRLEDRPEVLEAALPDTESLRGSETVLVVEDQKEVRDLTVAILRGFGYHVLEAANGGEAVRLCLHHTGRIDLMVTDVVMPGMSGRELADLIQPRRPEMKILYTSGYSGKVIMNEASSGLAYLAKPFSPESLARKVKDVLTRPPEPA